MRHLIYNLGDAMFKTLTIVLVLACVACKEKKQSVDASIAKTDTIIPATDTTATPYVVPDFLKDSLDWQHHMDSFYAIKPIISYSPDKNGDSYKKLIADVIDTTGVTTTPLAFSDTTIIKWNKRGDEIISEQQVLKNKRFTVEVFNLGNGSKNTPRKITINGNTLRKGIELDTSLSGEQYETLITIDHTACSLLTCGTKEYLLLSGHIERCNGMSCGVSYYLLYDPAINKGMVLEQFRSEFFTGYDKKNNTPVFINMKPYNEHSIEYQCYITAGQVYRLNQNGKIKPVTNKQGKPIDFTAWCKDETSPLHVIKGNFLN